MSGVQHTQIRNICNESTIYPGIKKIYILCFKSDLEHLDTQCTHSLINKCRMRHGGILSNVI